jgi:hypothetical protein
MFRRRTDQIYSTLQQVQRRITEQTGVSSPAMPGVETKGSIYTPTPPQPLVALRPLSQALPLESAPAPDGQQPITPFADQPAAGRRWLLQLPSELALTLMVVWLLSMALAFFLGHRMRSGQATVTPVAPAPRREEAQIVKETPSARRLGDYLLVLNSTPNDTVDSDNFLQNQASTLNEYVAKNAHLGWRPYFGVRRPRSGGLQLVFGYANGQYGVSKDEFKDFAELIAKPRPEGAGYRSAAWIKVTDGQ